MARNKTRADESPSIVSFYDLPADDRPTVLQVDIGAITPNPQQPRRVFDQKKLSELSRSIKETGILQPLVVAAREGGFLLVCGERRWQAARLAGLSSVPVVVREADAGQALVLGLIENLQREALNPMDEAYGFSSLIEDFGLTHADVARRVGKSRSHVTNLLRLTNLPSPVQELVRAGQLKPGHARGVLRLRAPDAQIKMAQRIVSESLSVRRVEHATPATRPGRRTKGSQVSRETISSEPPVASAAPLGPRSNPGRKASPASRFVSRELEHLTRAIEDRLGHDVGILWNGSGGELTIPFESQDQLLAFLSSILRS